ncbi:hypothetical protein [Streptomyces sp. NPDC058739]
MSKPRRHRIEYDRTQAWCVCRVEEFGLTVQIDEEVRQEGSDAFTS